MSAELQGMDAAGPLGLLEAMDRSGASVARLEVRHWPAMVGRALASDLVVGDAHLAAQHLRIERLQDGKVQVQVLDTVNGVTLRRKRHGRDETFEWPPGQDLWIGRLRLTLRLADAPIAPEEALPRLPWATSAWTICVLACVLAEVVGVAWLQNTETHKFMQGLPAQIGGAGAILALWAGLWALATKLFTGNQQFWRHVRIGCLALLAMEAMGLLVNLLAFMGSWESLVRFGFVAAAVVAAAGVFAHLHVIAPQRRQALALFVAGVLLAGVGASLGNNWLQTRRLTGKLYMSSLFPPGWRLAPTVPVAQFLGEAADIEQRLAQRLADKDADPAGSTDGDD